MALGAMLTRGAGPPIPVLPPSIAIEHYEGPGAGLVAHTWAKVSPHLGKAVPAASFPGASRQDREKVRQWWLVLVGRYRNG